MSTTTTTAAPTTTTAIPTTTTAAPITSHNHISPPYKMNFWAGNLKYRHSIQCHATAKIPAPDTDGQKFQGHINNIDGNTVIVPPVPHDELQPAYNLEAEYPRQTIDSGAVGRDIKDSSSVIIRPVEPPSSSDNTAGIWRRGKYFSGPIKI